MPLGVYAKPARAGKTGHRLSLAALLAQRPAQLPINARERVRVVLVIGVPASPMAQLWWVVGGNTVSALVGLVCVAPLPLPPWALGAAAVGQAIAAMLTARCLHPPGGAVALLMVLGGAHDWHYPAAPVGMNSLLLVLAGIGVNYLTGRR